MVVKVFISSNQTEFAKERKAILNGISSDSSLNTRVELFVFEEDIARSKPADETFINKVKQADVYIGLIGSVYGGIYKKGVSATEFEYNLYISEKSDAYFFVKKVKNRDEGSQKFLNRIRGAKKYKSFNTIEELVNEVKNSLNDYINNKLENKIFDKTIIEESTFDDVDENALNLFLDVLEDSRIESIIGERSFDKILEHIGAAIINENGIFHLTNAGALCFAKDISKFGLEHDIKMVRFNGNDRFEVIDKVFSKKSFFILIKEFEKFFYKNTKFGFVIRGFKRINIPEYPIDAIREAFINAIAHRDYNLKGNCITFYIYDNRIEIISPGKLPYPLTVKDLGIGVNPRHRNEIICKILEHTKYMEHVGTGITRMRRSMKDNGLKEPEFYDGNFFKVVFNGPNGKLVYDETKINDNIDDLSKFNLNKRQLDALSNMANNNKRFTYNSYSNSYGVSYSTSKRDLQDLCNKNLIRKIKEGKVNVFLI